MRTRKNLSATLILMSGIALLIACKKSDDPTVKKGSDTVSPVPGSFTQKLLIEQYTGAWNGGCPDGLYKMDQIINSNGGKAIGVNLHMGDAMEIPLFNAYISTFNNNNLPQFPSAMVNRIPSLGNIILSKTQWASNATVDLAYSAKCGLAIKSTISGTTASIEVHCGFKETLTGTYNLTVYIVENGVTGTGNTYDQVNTNTSNDPASPYYGKATPIQAFVHNHVVRKVLTANLGDPIASSSLITGGEDIKTYTANLSGMNSNNLEVVALINKVGNSPITHQVMNAQVCSINSLKNWD